MKTKGFETRHIQILGAIIFILLSIFLYSSTESLKKTLDTSVITNVRSDAVRMRLYEGVTSSEFEGKNLLSYSFRIPENAAVVTALQGKVLAVTQNNKVLGRVSFSYEGGRGYAPEEYIKEIILKDVSEKVPTFIQTIGERSFVSFKYDGDLYLVTKVDGGEWLATFQGTEKDEEDLRQIASTFNIKS